MGSYTKSTPILSYDMDWVRVLPSTPYGIDSITFRLHLCEPLYLRAGFPFIWELNPSEAGSPICHAPDCPYILRAWVAVITHAFDSLRTRPYYLFWVLHSAGEFNPYNSMPLMVLCIRVLPSTPYNSYSIGYICPPIRDIGWLPIP